MHLNELSDPYTRMVAAKRNFQVPLVLFGGEGYRLGVNCSFAESLSSKWAEHTEGAEWWVFSLTSKPCTSVESLGGCTILATWASYAADVLPLWNDLSRPTWPLLELRASMGRGAPLSYTEPPGQCRGGRSPAGPSTGGCFSAAALPLSLALLQLPWNVHHACAWLHSPWSGPGLCSPVTDFLGVPGLNPGRGPIPAPGWTCLTAMVWAGDLATSSYCGPALLTWPWGWALPHWWSPLGALFPSGTAPGCLWFVFCKTSS